MRRALAALAVALFLAGCGDSDEPGRYDAQLAEVRQAVEAGDRDAAFASLEDVGEAAFYAHAAGDVSDEELAELAGLLHLARAQIDEALPAPSTTTPAPTTTIPPAPVLESSDADDRDDRPGRGNGRGRGGDDGDDDDDD
jgi:hypothetical protein